MKISNVDVYGLRQSIRRSKFPMSVDIDNLTDEITDTVEKLATAEKGSGHDQFLTGIVVQFDLTFSIKAWVEAERYHFLDFVSSQSTMHRITRMDIAKCCNKYVMPGTPFVLQTLINEYKEDPTPERYLKVLYNVPVGFELTAGMSTNYRELKNIYSQRKAHRLPEWREFCTWIESLPESWMITGKKHED